jgi:DnaJ-class molecular chaperone
MQQYLNILWIWFGLSKEEIKNIYYSKTKEILPGIHKWANQEKMMFLNGAYNYVIENFDDYINGILP